MQEVRVSVQEVGVLPGTSATTTPPAPEVYVGSDDATKRHGYAQQDSQSDCEVVFVPDGELSATEVLPPR